MKTYYIDMHVHTDNSFEKHANLSPKETLEYYQNLAVLKGERIILRITDHENILGGIKTFDEYYANRDKYPNVFVIPGIECNASLHGLISYPDNAFETEEEFPYSDRNIKYVFKRAHICAAPILNSYENYLKWKNDEALNIYSKLNSLSFKKLLPNIVYEKQKVTVNTGEQILSAINIIEKKFNVTLPLKKFSSLTKNKLPHVVVMDQFYSIVVKTLFENENFKWTHGKQSLINHLKNLTSSVACTDFNYIKLAATSYKKLVKANDVICYQNTNNALSNEELRCYKEILNIKKTANVKKQVVKGSKERVINTGEQILAGRNLIKAKLGLEIPLTVLKSCLNDGLSHEQCVNYFYQATAEYIKNNDNHYNAHEIANIIDIVKKITAQALSHEPKFNEKANEYKKIDIIELCKIVNNAGGTIDFAHPSEILSFHTQTYIPSKCFNNINLMQLKPILTACPSSEAQGNDVQTNKKIYKTQLLEKIVNKINAGKPVLTDEINELDSLGIVKLLLAVNALREKKVLDDNKLIGAELPRKILYHDLYLNMFLDNYDKFHILPSYGTDTHMNFMHELMVKERHGLEVLNSKNELVKVTNQFLLKEIKNGIDNKLVEKINNLSYAELLKGFVDYPHSTRKRRQYHTDTKQRDTLLQYVDLPVQIAYTDYLMGKEVDVNTASLITIKGGSIIHIDDEEDKKSH